MDKVIAKDTTVDKAIRKGLDMLGVDSHEADIVIISEGKKGILDSDKKRLSWKSRAKKSGTLMKPAISN